MQKCKYGHVWKNFEDKERMRGNNEIIGNGEIRHMREQRDGEKQEWRGFNSMGENETVRMMREMTF